MASEYNSTTAELLDQARSALLEANNAENKIRGDNKPRLGETRFNYAVVKPAVQPPPTFSDVFGSDATSATMGWLDEQADEWVAKYFPHINACLKSLPEEWLCDVIGGSKPFGYSQTYFDLAWHNARDRAYRTRRSEVKSITETFGSRGFTLPPGAMVGAIDEANQRASDSILEVNRDQAMKDVEIKQQLLQFAEQQALQLKLGIQQSLADFMRTCLSVPDKELEKARIRAQATSSLYSALSSYYNVEVAFEGLRLQAAKTKIDMDGDIDERRIKLFGTDNNANVAVGRAVDAYAGVAAAAVNAAGTLVAQIESV